MPTAVHNPKGALLQKALLSLNKPAPMVVEIGCARSMNEAPTDGWSTVYLAQHESILWSVDIDEEALAIAKLLVKQHSQGHVIHNIVCSDGTSFLSQWNYPDIDLLYLDSSNDPLDTLTQAKVALPHMAEKGLILIDDVQPIGANWFGKGTMAIPFLVQQGWKCLIEPTLWQEENCWAMATCWKETHANTLAQ